MSEKRNWDAIHVDAGYHEQEWGPVPTAEAAIVGEYAYERDGGGEIRVSFEPRGVTGAEFALEWSDGMRVTVVDEATAVQYLEHYGATRLP